VIEEGLPDLQPVEQHVPVAVLITSYEQEDKDEQPLSRKCRNPATQETQAKTALGELSTDLSTSIGETSISLRLFQPHQSDWKSGLSFVLQCRHEQLPKAIMMIKENY
jgi:hypothetical protein